MEAGQRRPGQKQLHSLCRWAVGRFDRIIWGHTLFHTAFLLIAIVEGLLLIAMAVTWASSGAMAILLAIAFLTAFSYFVLRLYLSAKRPEQLIELRDDYLERMRHLLEYQEGIPEHHLALANATSRLASILADREYNYYRPPRWLKPLTPPLEKLSCWLHWGEVHAFRELLLLSAIEEQLKLVRCEPTDLEVHAALANAYTTLSSLYVDPRTLDGYDEDRWIPPGRYAPEMAEKFRRTAERAQEEFQILSQFAPNDPWVHAQLAYSYHDLQMAEEEMREYETILTLCPDDRETLFRLGVCYFQNGRNAAGLRVYEELRRTNYKQADDLIRFYGSQQVKLYT